MKLRTCIDPTGSFLFCIHKPSFTAENLRKDDFLSILGKDETGQALTNQRNFPPENVTEARAGEVLEIANPFPFRGTTYIGKAWADKHAAAPDAISLPQPPATSLSKTMRQWFSGDDLRQKTIEEAFTSLPIPLKLALATTSTDPEDLIRLARYACDFIYDQSGKQPIGLRYHSGNQESPRAIIHDHDLFEAVANNPSLPVAYRHVMVLKPGAQGGSEIVGEWRNETGTSHVYEYLRRNSYIPWGHYAANLADDCVRYRLAELTRDDMRGLRHLYYQRTYVRLARILNLPVPASRQWLTPIELEALRTAINDSAITTGWKKSPFTGTLWGWNFGFDFAPSRYRLHASHQQIHQQFALLPRTLPAQKTGAESAVDHMTSYGCGDLIAAFGQEYQACTGEDFFATYIKAIRNNRRMDNRADRSANLILFENQYVLAFVPKAQTSQWEIQLMATNTVGNILEADTPTRNALDAAMLSIMKTLENMGARLITTIEYSKRFDSTDTDQRLLYSFLPKLPQSPGAFSEAQLRWINGHYPEDFATACRNNLAKVEP